MYFNRKIEIFPNGVINVSTYEKYLYKSDINMKAHVEPEHDRLALEMIAGEFECDVDIITQKKGGRTVERSSEYEKNREKNLYRARKRIRDLCNANSLQLTKFVTLTFAQDMTDITESNNELKKFVKRLNRRFGNIKYVAVPELTEKGRIHYHMLVNLPYIEKDTLYSLWQNGFVDIKKIDHVDNVGAYICKYLTKSTTEWLGSNKCYLSSRNLDKPIVIRDCLTEGNGNYTIDKETGEVIEFDTDYLVYSDKNKNEFCGEVKFKQFNLNRDPNTCI